MRGMIVAFLVVAAGIGLWTFEGRGQVTQPKKEPAKKPDKKTVKELMARKLEHSQKLLGALVTNKLDDAAQQAEAIMKVRKEAAWMMYKTKDYEMWSNEFDAAAQKIVKAAKDKNLDIAKLAYLEMTMTCFHCHAYVRDLGDIRLELPSGE